MTYRILSFVGVGLVLGSLIYSVDQNRRVIVFSEIQDPKVSSLFSNPEERRSFWSYLDQNIKSPAFNFNAELLKQQIHTSSESGKLTLSISSKQQEQSRQILMTVAKLLQQYLVEQQQQEKVSLQKTADEHLQAWNKKEKEQMELQKTYDLLLPQVPFEQKEKSLTDILSKKEERLRKVSGDLEVLKTLDSNMNFSLNYLDIDVPSAKKYREVDQMYQSLKSRYKSKHPRIFEIQSELNLLKQNLFQELVEEKRSLDAQVSNLRGTLENLKGDILEISPIREKLALLKMEAERHKKEYKETIAAYEIFLSQPPFNLSYSLKFKKDTGALKKGMGMLGGSIVLALLMFLLISYFDQQVYHEKHIYRAHKDFVVLAVTPKPSQKEQVSLISHQFPNSSFSKSIQVMRNRLLSLANAHQVILVTAAKRYFSPVSIVSNLAISFAQIQKKVLLIDCSFSDPRQHRFFKLKNKGLAHLLRHECSVNEVLHKVEVPNLTVMPSGEGLGFKLLQSVAFRDFLNTFKSEFDYIFLDAPSLSHGTEAVLIAKDTDGIILTVPSGQVARAHLKWAKHELESSGVPLLGVVLKKVPNTTMVQGGA